jgi:SAM-dependent methyltransferase
MVASDSVFAGSIPELYDRCLGPLLFEPYAEEIARRAAALAPSRILETAAGTGIVTAALAGALPEAEIVATDLNPAMLDVAQGRTRSRLVSFQPADAQQLPFGTSEFDLVVCQFGVMFFPDRVGAYREARRVLRPGGWLLLALWDRIEANPAAAAAARAVADLFPDDPPGFLARTPYGYHDRALIETELVAAGFTLDAIETVCRESRGAASDAAWGLCQGSPLRSEIAARAPGRLDEATEAAAAALRELCGGAEQIAMPMSALIVTARAPLAST